MKKIFLAFLFVCVPTVSFAQLADTDLDAQNWCTDIKTNLRLRDRDANTNGGVSLLQDFLREKGFLKSEPTGFFGQVTLGAVKKFQISRGILPTGFVGSLTREAIKRQSGCDGVNKSHTVTSAPSVRTSIQNILPPGCTSTSGFSSVTGWACDGTMPPSPLPPGCSSLNGFSSITGLACSGVLLREVKSNLPEIYRIELKRDVDSDLYAEAGGIVREGKHTISGRNLYIPGQETYIIIAGIKIKTVPVGEAEWLKLEFVAPIMLPIGIQTYYVVNQFGKSEVKKIYILSETVTNVKQNTSRPILEYVETKMTRDSMINTVYRGGQAYLRGFHLFAYGPAEKISFGRKEISPKLRTPSEIEFIVPKDTPLGKQKISIPGAASSITVNVIEGVTPATWLRVVSPNGGEKFTPNQPISVEYTSSGLEGEEMAVILIDSKGFYENTGRMLLSLPVKKNETVVLFSGSTPTNSGRYKVQLCSFNVYLNGAYICDTSDTFIEILPETFVQ